ncbi:Xylose isomerase-like TIM barrel [compost metagenome]|uniref:Sugar phosphate isomerase/epimerase n=1 Tax=Silvania hatchlandensis TaxID=2926469 RepID=A0A9J6Q1Z4_9ENTR|nr:TIM barrel protein [Silvania hatchlandensis]MCU6663686.1 sugar phosphate isomerase/epimerase [Silvania hatchlandensis]
MENSDKKRLAERARNIPLYLHAYAFHLNMRYERVLPADLLDIAHQQKLNGVKIHVEDGETKSLQKLSNPQLQQFKEKAQAYNLDIHIETSASDKATLDDAIRIARATGATSVRFYPRYEGYLNDVLDKIASDIAYLSRFDDCGLTFTLEQHEDLQGHELVTLVKNSGMKNLSILFDFGNMINANEQPLAALEVMAPLITQVHIKDALIIKEGKGWGHQACRTGYGDLPIEEMLKSLLMLGEDTPQVTSFGLEEEVEYYAPAFRFEDEENNPWIPWRNASYTPLPESTLVDARLAEEKNHAISQIHYIRNLCDKFINSR